MAYSSYNFTFKLARLHTQRRSTVTLFTLLFPTKSRRPVTSTRPLIVAISRNLCRTGLNFYVSSQAPPPRRMLEYLKIATLYPIIFHIHSPFRLQRPESAMQDPKALKILLRGNVFTKV